MHNSFMWLHTYPVCYLKLVKRCELELKQPAVQRVSSVQLATSNLKVINSLNDIQIGVVNRVYKWLESLKLSLALQLAKFRN